MLINKSRGKAHSKPVLIFFQPTRKWIFRTPTGRAAKYISPEAFKKMTREFKECNGKFSAASRTWAFDDIFLSNVKRILSEMYGPHGFLVREPPPKQNASFSTDPEPFSRFQEITGVDISSLPEEERKKIYRRFVVKLHPDLGGDHEKMSELNRAWHLIKLGAKPSSSSTIEDDAF